MRNNLRTFSSRFLTRLASLNKVADIEEKLDVLIKAYMQDRERLYALPHVPELQHSIHGSRQPPPSGGAGCGILTGGPSTSGTLKPKPILVDKQFSEPSSPTAKSYDQQTGAQALQRRPPMHRGHSDLGNRIKKRVTLRYVWQILQDIDYK